MSIESSSKFYYDILVMIFLHKTTIILLANNTDVRVAVRNVKVFENSSIIL